MYKIRIKLAVLNLLRHRLRSLLSIGMISSSIIAMMFFFGFTDSSLVAFKKLCAESQFGNLQIAHQRFWSPKNETHKDKLINLEELQPTLKNFPEIEKYSGRLSTFGLLTNNDQSVSAKITGIDYKIENKFKDALHIVDGNFIPNEGNEDYIIIGKILARELGVNPGDSLVYLSHSIDGVMNTLDLKISGIYMSGIDEIDRQVIFTHLTSVQKLLDTKNVDVAVVKLKDIDDAKDLTLKINQLFKNKNSSLYSKYWWELASLYRQIEAFYFSQNIIVGLILFTLVFLGILNSVSMSVVERIGEIGTTRSLGESKKDVLKQFIIESIILTLCSIITGSILSKVFIILFNSANIKSELPGASAPITIDINFVPKVLIISSVCALIISIIATIVPVSRILKTSIVESLKKNI